jgi:hypothetical protein
MLIQAGLQGAGEKADGNKNRWKGNPPEKRGVEKLSIWFFQIWDVYEFIFEFRIYLEYYDYYGSMASK